MKYVHKCEFNGCSKSANRHSKNGHWFCHDCFKKLMSSNRRLGHDLFLKEIVIGSVGSFKLYIDRYVKFI